MKELFQVFISFIRLSRYPNLILIGLLCVAIYHELFLPAYLAYDLSPSLSLPVFLLLTIDILIIAASGYIINDFYDVPIDHINKPTRVIVSREISLRTAVGLYVMLLLMGMAITLLLAAYIDKLHYWILFPFAALVLWLYSRYLKRMPILGNLFVGLFVGSIPLLILIGERHALLKLSEIAPGQASYVAVHCFIFAGFAFMSNLIREIVKDIEDFRGDFQRGLKTVPILIGIKRTKWLIAMFLLVLIGVQIFWFSNLEKTLQKVILSGFLIVPTVYLVFFNHRAKIKRDFTFMSRVLKLIMIFGITLLFFL
jgi:4-hydroxybenzoate polyprenyltransferase